MTMMRKLISETFPTLASKSVENPILILMIKWGKAKNQGNPFIDHSKLKEIRILVRVNHPYLYMES